MAYDKIKDLPPEEITELNPIEFVSDMIDEFIGEVSPESAFEEFQEDINNGNQEQKQFTEIMVARFFDNLAYADHKEHMSGLLYGLLKENKLVNLRKAVSIDPSVRYLPAVENYINNSSDYNQSILRGYIVEALDSPFLTNGKNKFSPSLLLFITALDTMTLLDGDIKLDIDEIYSLVKEYKLDYVEDNPDIVLEKPYLKTLLEQHLENKVKESKINFDFLTT